MAFNPFHTFRKHQKTMFAGLTIVCMLTFVLTGFGFGGADYFSYISAKLGYRRVKDKDKAAQLYGQVVSADDLNEVQRQRTVANFYMRFAIAVAHMEVIRSINDNLLKDLPTDDPGRLEVQQVLSHWMGANS